MWIIQLTTDSLGGGYVWERKRNQKLQKVANAVKVASKQTIRLFTVEKKSGI